MENSIFKQAAAYLKRQRNNRRWQVVVACLALVVIAGTAVTLKLTGQARTHQQKVLNCQLEVHQHDDTCYDEDKNLICSYADYVVHTHNEDCYDTDGNLVCQLAEVEKHTHDASCCDENGNLICGKLELHTHDKACYDENNNLICGQIELKEHVHSDAEGCFETVELTDEEVAALNGTDADTADEEDATEVSDETQVYTKSYSGEDYTVTVTYGEDAEIPEETVFTAEELQVGTEEYENYYKEMAEFLENEDSTEESFNPTFLRLFDMKFTLNGEEIEPAAPVQVQITYDEAVETENRGYIHFAEDGTEVLPAEISEDGTQITVTQNSFSIIGDVSDSLLGNLNSGIATTAITGSDTVEVGSTIDLTGTVSDATSWKTNSSRDYTDESWSSSNTGIATVTVKDSNNSNIATVTGENVGGPITITHTYCQKSTNGRGQTSYTTRTESFTVTVIDSGTKYKATVDSSTVKKGSSINFTETSITFSTADGETETVEMSNFDWSSQDTTIASVNKTNGTVTVTGVKSGSTTITATKTVGTGNEKKTYTLTWNITVPYTVTYLVSADWSDNTRTFDSLGFTPAGWFYGDDTTTGTVKTIDKADEQYVIGVVGLDSATTTTSGFECVDQVGGDGTYVLKSPTSTTRVAYADKGNKLATFTFSGWLVNGVLKSPGDQITVTANMTVTAKWYAKKTQTAQYYLNIQSGSGTTLDGDNWTGALYTSSIETNLTSISSSDRNLFYGVGNDAGQATIANMSAADAYVRANATTGIYTSNSNRNSKEYMKVTSAFPTDAEIFARLNTWGLRGGEKQITVNGEKVNVADINTKNYVIYWARVFGNDDTWHFDGVITPKTGKLVVTKTFVGDKTVIDQVKENYYITVKQGNDIAYTLYPVAKDSISNGTGYTSYDEETQTYTWELDVTQLKDYTVQENNYVASGDYVTSATYQISGAEETNYNTDGWQTYTTSGTTPFRCYSVYDDNDPKTTVSLRNVYVKKWTMSIFKTDKTTSHALAGVEFELEVKDANGNVVEVSDESGNIINSTGDQNTTKRVITDDNGNIDIVFPETPGTYTFTLTEIFASEDTSEEESEELVTTGYKTIGDITGTAYIQSDGYVKVQNLSVANPPDGKTVTVDDSGAIINVVNHSETASMTVNKVWTDNTNKPVTMQLLRNGSPISDMTLVLTESNQWTGTWDNLPLYVDGKKAEYSVREIQIGEDNESDTRKYTPQDDASDGYADYIVVTQPTVETEDSDGNVTYTVTVQNTKDNGQVVFTKVDEKGKALAGAEFTVYTDAACTSDQIAKIKNGNTEEDAVFISDGNGVVTIVGLTTGDYYVKETKAPAGYQLDETVYILNAKANNSSLKKDDGTAVIQVVNQKAEVTLLLVKRTSGTKTSGAPNLEGAIFDLYSASSFENGSIKDGAEPIVKGITSGKDAVTIATLKQEGTYYLVETKAPDGYNLSNQAIPIKIEGGSATITASTDSSPECKPTIDENQKTVPNSYTITVYNSTGQELPSTGGIGTYKFTLGGIAILGFGCVMGLSMRRKRERRSN